MRREAFKFCDLLRLILETLRYVLRCIKKMMCPCSSNYGNGQYTSLYAMPCLRRNPNIPYLHCPNRFKIYVIEMPFLFHDNGTPKGVSPMFTRPYVPQYLCSPLYDISPYVSHVPQSLCYPEMFPSPVVHRIYILITQSLCSPVPMFPIFPSTHDSHIPQSLYSPVPIFPSPYIPQSLYSPVPMFPKHAPMFPQLVYQSLCSPVLFHRSIFHSLCPPNMFPSPYVYILNRYHLCNNVFVCAFSWKFVVTFEFGVVPIWRELLIYLL